MKKSSIHYFIVYIICLLFFKCIEVSAQDQSIKTISASGKQDRKYWCDLLYKIAYPVIHHLSNDQLKQKMPVEKAKDYLLHAEKVTYLEAVGRTMSGIAPWLALPDDTTKEGVMRKQLRTALLKGLQHAVDPLSKDYLNFRTESQPIVDAAFMAHAFLRATQQLWEPLDSLTKQRFILEFKSLRNRKAGYNNWLLFAGITEAFLMKIGEQYDPARIDFAFQKMKEWYVGDGWYKDGEKFAMDYYNSYVIQPMLVDMLSVMVEKKMASQQEYDEALKRMIRFAEFQERIISPEGTYPPLGRSLTYRIASFQALSQIALMQKLPDEIAPAQVRCALTKVMHTIFDASGTFSNEGWLQLGLVGHQPSIADQYTSTGSLYLCTTGFLALGLPAENNFWSAPYTYWTSKKVWEGQPVKRDYKVSY